MVCELPQETDGLGCMRASHWDVASAARRCKVATLKSAAINPQIRKLYNAGHFYLAKVQRSPKTALVLY